MERTENEYIEAAHDLLTGWPDEKRHALVRDNPDWNKIAPALVGYLVTSDLLQDISSSAVILRTMAEVIYCLGYECGRRSQALNLILQATGQLEAQ